MLVDLYSGCKPIVYSSAHCTDGAGGSMFLACPAICACLGGGILWPACCRLVVIFLSFSSPSLFYYLQLCK